MRRCPAEVTPAIYLWWSRSGKNTFNAGYWTLCAKNPTSKVLYVSSETFTNDFINSIQSGKNNSFRERYRNVDVLLIDDIQFIAKKEQTQEEFFHTFNELYHNNKQIVLTCDRSPKEMKSLEERLRSRFEWGLITDITPPDYETRIAILKKKAQLDRKDVPDDVIEYIAKHIKNNIRTRRSSY